MLTSKNKVLIKTVPTRRHANTLKGIPVGSFRIAAKLNLRIGKEFRGISYVDMMNNAIMTDVKGGYIKSSHTLSHIGIGDALAWFAFFDGKYRRSGKDGEYTNRFVSKDEIVETCLIDDEREYIRKRGDCVAVRFVFSRDSSFGCKFEGIFLQESINIYELDGRIIGETVLKRYDEWEQYL